MLQRAMHEMHYLIYEPCLPLSVLYISRQARPLHARSYLPLQMETREVNLWVWNEGYLCEELLSFKIQVFDTRNATVLEGLNEPA